MSPMRIARRGLVFSLLSGIAACSGTREGVSMSDGRSSPAVAARPQATSHVDEASAARRAGPYLAGEGTRFTFRGKYAGKRDEHTIELRAAYAGEERVLYFAQVGWGSRLTAATFGRGAFVQRADGLYTADVFEVPDDIEKLPREKFGLLLARPAKVGAESTAFFPGKTVTSSMVERYEVAAFERVTVPAGTFDDCVKLVIESRFGPERPEHATVWLAPGIGPVKIARSTGRLDELTKLTPSPARPSNVTASGAAIAAPSTTALTSEEKALVDKLCTEATCAGPRARLDLWRDPKGKIKHVVYDGDRDRCTDPPRFLFESDGKRRLAWSLEPLGPDAPPRADYVRAQSEILAGLTQGQTIVCGQVAK